MKVPRVRNAVLLQGLKFGAVGGFLILIDWAVFVLLTRAGLGAVQANICGRVVGAMTGFFLNGMVTFRRDGNANLGWHRLLRFALAWAGMTILSTACVGIVDRRLGLGAAWVAKPAIDAVLALLGFLVSRHWIYR
jgi:putative flippase GtrA